MNYLNIILSFVVSLTHETKLSITFILLVFDETILC